MPLSNGRLDTSALVLGSGFRPIEAGAGGLLLPTVARQHDLMADHFARDVGEQLLYSEGYRNLPRQNLKWSQHLAGGTLAAFPGTSTHGEAVTIDYASGVGYGGTAASNWMDVWGPLYGFVADVPSERWHRHYALIPTLTAAAPAAAAAPTVQEDDMADRLKLVQVTGKQPKKAPVDWYLANIDRQTVMHLGDRGLRFHRNLGIDEVTGEQPRDVLSGYDVVAGKFS